MYMSKCFLYFLIWIFTMDLMNVSGQLVSVAALTDWYLVRYARWDCYVLVQIVLSFRACGYALYWLQCLCCDGVFLHYANICE